MGERLPMRQAIGTPVFIKRVRSLVATAGVSPASVDSPNDLFNFAFHPEANAGWSAYPESTSSIDEVCVGTAVFAGIVITKNSGTTVKEALPVKLGRSRV
ncbi:MAG: hypothetical protein M3P18_22640 [Actinomycetota bacterium]|nr:hypothetical protein [Actinomycetota bacterium]